MAEQLICNQQVDGSTPFTSSSIYGGFPERPKGADCKSVVTDFGGPNPPSPTIRNRLFGVGFSYGGGWPNFGHAHEVSVVRISKRSEDILGGAEHPHRNLILLGGETNSL